MRPTATSLFRPFSLLLAVLISLGWLQCASASTYDTGSPPECCVRHGDTGADAAPDLGSELERAMVACPAGCFAATIAPHDAHAWPIAFPSAFARLHPQIAGRTLAPDPHPPRLNFSA